MLHLKRSKENTYLSFIISSQKIFLVISGNKQRSKTSYKEEIFKFMAKKTIRKKNLIEGNGFWKTSNLFFQGKMNKSTYERKTIVKRSCKLSMCVNFLSWIYKFLDTTDVYSLVMKRHVKTLWWKRITSTILWSFL